MKNNLRVTIFTILVSFLTLTIASCGSSKAETDNANQANAEPERVSVATTKAVIEQIPTYFEATGSLTSDAESNVAPNVSGKIVAVNFDIGTYVKKGDVLVRLDPRDAQINLERSQAQVEQQKEAVKQAEAGVGQAIANLRQTQARLGVGDGETFNINDFSQVKTISAQLDLAQKELQRYEKLLETGDVSRSIYDQKKAQRDQLLGQLDEARSNAAVAIKAISVAQSGVISARAQVASAKAGVEAAQTQIEQARKTVSDNVVRSPLSGYVSERNADPGEYISPNQPNAKIATVVRTAVLRLQIDVPEQSIGKISVGQSVSAQVSAYPDQKFAGTIVRVAPSLNTQSRTLTVEAEIENVNGLLKPGQFATVRVTQSKPESAVMIPANAVRSDGEKSVVFVIKDGIANERLVQTGLLENNMIEIKQGVQENEIVATDNLDKLGDGVIVNQNN